LDAGGKAKHDAGRRRAGHRQPGDGDGGILVAVACSNRMASPFTASGIAAAIEA
jgi:hypothetical protein